VRPAEPTLLPPSLLVKSPSGINGLDEITNGGFPQGRPTLICGNAGCGKTVFAMEFLVKGALQCGEPGVFVSFEETADDLRKNFSSLGFDLASLEKEKKIVLSYVHVDKSEIIETGAYDLEGLFIRLEHSINSIGAKRIVLDTIESLFSGFTNDALLRAELRRLFRWLKEKGVTAVITGERGGAALTRQGIEEYVSDCVILLDNRVINQISTRRITIVKYRGSPHGTNEYPFLIDSEGVSVLPITSLELDSHKGHDTRISTGIDDLDKMLGGQGIFKGSTMLISGSAGTGKTSVAGHLAKATCRSNEKCLFFCFEESTNQFLSNMRSIGLDLFSEIERGYLIVKSARPTMHGLEEHLVKIHRLIEETKPSLVIMDPITSFINSGTVSDIGLMLTRLFDYMKIRDITSAFTMLTDGGESQDQASLGISSIADVWISIARIRSKGTLTRELSVVKARGIGHSDSSREVLISSSGVSLAELNRSLPPEIKNAGGR